MQIPKHWKGKSKTLEDTPLLVVFFSPWFLTYTLKLFERIMDLYLPLFSSLGSSRSRNCRSCLWQRSSHCSEQHLPATSHTMTTVFRVLSTRRSLLICCVWTGCSSVIWVYLSGPKNARAEIFLISCLWQTKAYLPAQWTLMSPTLAHHKAGDAFRCHVPRLWLFLRIGLFIALCIHSSLPSVYYYLLMPNSKRENRSKSWLCMPVARAVPRVFSCLGMQGFLGCAEYDRSFG